MRLFRCLLAWWVGGLWAQAFEADTWLDELGESLAYSSAEGDLRARLSGSLDIDMFAFEAPPPGVLQTEDSWLVQPRLTLFLDAQWGDRFYGFSQARVDRGFDPAANGMRGRLDEYALRVTPWKDGRLSLQAGQFATVMGRWVLRHLSKNNPFVSAPLAYENVTRLTDLRAPWTEAYLSQELGIGNRYYYNPVIWGPAYTSGVAASGRWSRWEWAVEFKNASPFSRPSLWGLSKTGFSEPTWSGRLGWKPNLQWQFGLSASEGVFLSEDARRPDSTARGDYRQRLFILDASYALHHLEVWGEWMHSTFTAPGIRNLDTTAWFVESRYRFSVLFSGAVRWNEQHFSKVLGYWGALERWGGPVRRLDISGTWRLTAHSHFKLEVNLRNGEDSLEGTGWGGAAQFSVRF